MTRPSQSHRFRFGSFELDARSGELWRDGVRIRLQEQPFRALLMLVEHPGDVVTRDQLRRRVWSDETFVDFDHGLNSIMTRLREALGDSAENPLFIQTLPRHGYRFVAPVDQVLPAPFDTVLESAPAAASTAGLPPPAERHDDAPALPARSLAAIAAIAVFAVGALLIWLIAPRDGGPPAESGVRLAVLPFDNFTGDQEQQFFVDGLHEELTFRLGRMQPHRLAVIARTSVMPYRGSSKTVAAIARELGVDYVLEGSVRRGGDRFRITAQLIRSADQAHLWTETYERSWTDLFAIQTDVSARVADSLAVKLVPSYLAAVERQRKVSPKAYEHYLKGRFFWHQRARDMSGQLARAVDQFKLAIVEEPGYELAYVGLADAYNSFAFSDPAGGHDAYPKAREAIQRALQLDERLASAHATLAWMTMHFDHDWEMAERAFQRALELDPNDSLARFRYSHLLAVRGRLTKAISEAEAARKADPLSASIADILAWYLYYSGADTQALQRMREAADLDGNWTRFHAFGAYVYAVRRDCDRAAGELARLPHAAEFPRFTEGAFAVARCGDPQAESLRQELLARRLAFPVAMVHFGRGETDAFYAWLNRAIDTRSPEVLYIGVDPAFQRERDKPLFQAALRRLGL